ncbi:MAG: putative toxin-antitoxin system toxin component, PIN family [Thermomicrobiales bacterium]
MSDELLVVLDTNVIVSGIIVPRGGPAAILDAWRQGRFALLTSPEQLIEPEQTLRRPVFARRYGVDDEVVDALVALLRQEAHLIVPPEETTIAVRDPDDGRILMIGVAGQGNFLVTGDDDLLSIADDPHLGNLQIVAVRTFRAILDSVE